MKERPILFSAPMVRALLAGTKTQTRRVIPQRAMSSKDDLRNSPRYGQPGDRLWMRETFMDLGACYLYRADAGAEAERALAAPGQPWKPAIHMPRAASRISLEVTGVRIERLQEITKADAIAEGVPADPGCMPWDDTAAFHRLGPVQGDSFPIARYAALWESINGPGSWKANPWVWVVEFRRI